MSRGSQNLKELRVVMDYYAQHWIPVARSTERADFARAERAALMLYRELKPPKAVLKMSSPYGALIACELARAVLGTKYPEAIAADDWFERRQHDRDLLDPKSEQGWIRWVNRSDEVWLANSLSTAGRRELRQRIGAALSRATLHLADSWALRDRRQHFSDQRNAQLDHAVAEQARAQLSTYSINESLAGPPKIFEQEIHQRPLKVITPNFPDMLMRLAINQFGIEGLNGRPFGPGVPWAVRDLVESCGGLVACHDVLAISDRPHTLKIDAAGRLHCDDGPAVSWRDGFALYYWHGISVNQKVIMKPDSITLKEIHKCDNAEVRRVLIERYGEPRYIADSGMNPVASDPRFGDLFVEYRVGTRPLARIRVTNRTPELDGSYKSYWLSINPFLYDGAAGRIPQAAVASTWRTTPGGEKLFFKDYRDYRPGFES